MYDLPQIRADIANRGTIVAAAADDWSPASYFRRHTVAFLTAHPECRIGIRDEYGVDHPITDDLNEGGEEP